MDLELLRRPFKVKEISWRVGATYQDKAIALAYVDARDVMKRLDDVCGIEGWQNRYSHVTAQGVVCDIGIRSPTELGHVWIWKSNGAGETNVEGEKGALSDAFKRAAVLWGVARYLYKLPTVWVGYDKTKKKLLEIPTLPTWATPDGYDKLMEKRND